MSASSFADGRGWSSIGGFFANTAKVVINNDTALSISTVFAAINAISQDIAKMPKHVFKAEGPNRVPQPGHSLDRILNKQPNPFMNAMDFWETMIAHALGWGNGYAEIQRDAAGNPVALWLLRPDRVSNIRRRTDGGLVYTWTNEKGGTENIRGEDIFHLKGLGYDGVVGYNVIAKGRETMGLAAATEKFGGTFFGNGCNVGNIITTEKKLSTEAQKRLRQQINDVHGGVLQGHKTMVLEEGMMFAKDTIPPEESQFLQTRQFSVIEICRWFRIPPSKVQDLNNSTFNNNEQQNINYVTDSLTGWIARIENEMWSKLLSESEQVGGYYVKHNVAALMRGDVKARGLFYRTMWGIGVFSTNEVRAFEDLNPIKNGDQHFVPMNMTSLENPKPVDAQVVSPAESIVDNIAGRLAKAEIAEVSKHIIHRASDGGKFLEWVDKFYGKHNDHVQNACQPLTIFNKKLQLKVKDLTLRDSILAGDDVDLDVDNRKQHIKAVLLGAISDA